MDINQKTHIEWVELLSGGNIDPKELVESAIFQNIDFVWHPLGFILGVLSSSGSKKIRLHIWPGNRDRAQLPLWPIHDHIFDMRSWVLLGEINNIEYQENNSGNESQLYYVYYDKNKSVLKRTNSKLQLIQSKKINVKKGEEYSIPAGTMHNSKSPLSMISITVCETENKLERNPFVSGSLTGSNEYIFHRTRVDTNEVFEIIKKI